jgi:SAM-dependent methyltransferase
MSAGHRHCPVCGATQSVLLARLEWRLFTDHPLLVAAAEQSAPQGATVYDVHSCAICGMSFAAPVASREAFEAYYAHWSRYASGTDSLSGPSNEASRDRYRGTVDRVAPHLPTSDACILDVGCMEGGLLEAFQAHGHVGVAGVDPAPESMLRAAQKGLDVRIGTVEAIPFPDETFDLVLCVHVLEHVANLSRLDLFRVLTREGRLYVEVPDAASYNADTPDIFSDLSLEHINHFDLQSLVGLFQRHGFRAVETGTRTYFPAPGRPAIQDSIWGIFERDIAVSNVREECPSDYSRLRLYLDESLRRAVELNARLEAFVTPGEIFHLWGTGHGAFRLLGFPALRVGQLCSATDINPLYWGKQLAGAVVVPPEAFLTTGGKVVVTSAIHGQAIAARLRENGWVGDIFVP